MYSVSDNHNLKLLYWSVLSSFLVFIAKLCYDQYRIMRMVGKFDGPKRSSLLWGNWDILTQPTDELCKSLKQISRDYYPHYTLRVLFNVGVTLLSPEDCEIFLSTKKHTTKSHIYVIYYNWLKQGLLISSGEKYDRRRKILTPAFHFNVLKDFLNIFNEHTEKLVENIAENCSEPIDVVPLVNEFALYAISETSMGVKLDTQNKEQKEYRDAIHGIGDILVRRIMRPWLYDPLIYYFSSENKEEQRLLKILHGFTRNIIKERMESFNKSETENRANKSVYDSDIYMSKQKKRPIMLDILLQAQKDGGHIDYEGICEEVDTFMFEGHDTTSAVLGFGLMLIANHPEIQEQIYQEIKSTIGEKIRQPTYNELQKMDYLDRCIKETLRLYPSVHLLSRVVDEDVTLHSGMVVPKNTKVVMHIFNVHRNPEIYPDPEKFDPDRFLPENCKNRHPYAYIPFSAGPRNCIGQKFAVLEMKALVTGILQRFQLSAVDTPETAQVRLEVILRPKNGIRVKFNERN